MALYQTHTDTIAKHFDRFAPERDTWRGRGRAYHAALAHLCGFLIPPGAKVLEVGCSTGELLHQLQPSHGLGVDISGESIALARQKFPRLHFLTGDIQNLVLDETFDYILLAGTIGYLSDVQQALDHLRQFCTPQTRLVIVHHSYLWEPLLNLAEKLGLRMPQPPQNWLSNEDLVNMVQLGGFEAIKQGHHGLCPVSLGGLEGWLNRYPAHLPGLSALCVDNYLVARLNPRPRAALPSISVVIPARNEQGNIENSLSQMPRIGGHTQVIYVEGHSSDDTWAEIQRVARRYPDWDIQIHQQTGKGKGDAVRLGFAQATGDILVILDADLTVTPADLTKFYDALVSGRCEFANGSRLVYPRSAEAMPWLNTVANKLFGLAFSYLLGQRFKDTLCGTKALWRTDYERIASGRAYFGDFDPFGDFDLLFGAAKLSLKILDVPVRYHERVYGQSNIQHVREGLILLRMCLYASQKIKFF
ncbi:bifunctional class I SAM-dependent methyltransferase/glycosyltransferase family 2 protein [Candidatus Cyanaurora vandensis]|uniref:bifunctional class I SAM-dependent methyltransferase/glycosyltransferase family 2 protein n=1 Tax=Candidatus Cyanaurora vandensis TaxID=2714958 RepID=UPI00257DCBEF|nr:bifunctional class I SAM-dependent methyltransferase/glycosyltransferase family 2 protein [Candidatus Cyanaurora vandensis]